MGLLNIMKNMTELLIYKTTDFLKALFTQTPMMKDGKWFVLEMLPWGLVSANVKKWNVNL